MRKFFLYDKVSQTTFFPKKINMVDFFDVYTKCIENKYCNCNNSLYKRTINTVNKHINICTHHKNKEYFDF